MIKKIMGWFRDSQDLKKSDLTPLRKALDEQEAALKSLAKAVEKWKKT